MTSSEPPRGRPLSPSPQTPLHSTTPGPRAAALQKLYNDAITHLLRTCSYPNFAACFPTPARHVPSDLRDVHGQFVGKLDHWLRREFESILLARDVVPSLDELDRLIEDARRRKAEAMASQNGEGGQQPIPPHTLPPTQLYLSHLAPTLGMYEAEMKGRQDALAEENRVLLEKVLRQRREIEGIVAGLEKVVEDLRGSADALDPEEMDSLKEEVRAVDEVMRSRVESG